MKNNPKKLQLNRETLRAITDVQVENVEGAWLYKTFLCSLKTDVLTYCVCPKTMA